MKIEAIKTKIVGSTGGQKTIAVVLNQRFEASVPFGISAGKREAFQLPVKQALDKIEKVIAPEIIDRNFKSQEEFDNFLTKLDKTSNKRNLGGNSILALSIAFLRALAKERPLWQYIAQIAKTKPKLPTPAVLLIEGGKHGKGKLSFQEFLLLPEAKTFQEKYQLAKKIEKRLFLKNERGAEGAFIPNITDKEALSLIQKAIGKEKAKLYLDIAASSFKKKPSSKEYLALLKEFPLISSIEDPFSENDFASWKSFKKLLGKKITIIGDDLTTTNPKEITKAKDLCNGVIIKPNQIGTVSETIKAFLLAKKFKWKIIVSHRARETMDDFIADLAAGLGADFIKAGGLGQKERIAKYNRLLAIEKELTYNNL